MLLAMPSNGSIGNQISPEGDGDPPDQRNHPIEQSTVCRTSTESCCAEQLRVEVRRDEKVSLLDACMSERMFAVVSLTESSINKVSGHRTETTVGTIPRNRCSEC